MKDSWAFSHDEENYHFSSTNKEETILEGAAFYENEVFYIGKCVDPPQPEDFWRADDWLENVAVQEEYSMECAENWDSGITKEQKVELETEVREVLKKWLDKYDNRPKFFMVEEVEKIVPSEKTDEF